MTRETYKRYIADMHGAPMADVPSWRQQQIAAAKPVTSESAPFRSDELIANEVRNAHDETLGSVDDLVMSPQTGKIAYLVIARGGFFGIGERYVAVPWEDFKVTPAVNLLVLDATKAAMDAAPKVSGERFAPPGQYEEQSQKVDAYWKTHLSNKGGPASKG